MDNLEQIKKFLGLTDEEAQEYINRQKNQKVTGRKDGLVERVNKKIIDAKSGKQLLREVKYESN